MRRTAIKDISAYCAFLLGFIGAAPFAWQYLSAQLQSGEFVRGLWYFFALISVSGLVCGVVGLVLGSIGGAIWEQIHRRRRTRTAGAAEESVVADAHAIADAPALRLVPDNVVSLPDLAGRQVSSVRFLRERIEFDFGGVVVHTSDNPIVSTGLQKFRYPDAGSRDALCALIGASVETTRSLPGERLELRFANDRQLIVPNIRSRIVTIRNHT